MKKIAFLIPGLGIIERGAENFVMELTKKISKKFEIVIYSRGVHPELKNRQNVKLIIVKSLSRNNLFFNLLYKLHPFISRVLDKFNLSPNEIEMLTFSLMSSFFLLRSNYKLIFPVNGFWGVLLCRLIRYIRKTPFIYVAHGGEQIDIVKQRPDKYIATTLYTYRWLKKKSLDNNICYIPNGVDTNKFTPGNSKLRLPLEKPIILVIGAFITAKRLDLAIKATALLKKGSLLIIGFGSLEKYLELLGKNLLPKNRFLLAHAKYPQLLDYYRASDLFTLPSDRDPSPLVFLEAMACNLPIVAPDDERRISILGKAALYCDVENIDEYSKTLEIALGKNWKNLPRQQAEKYNWDIIASKYTKLLVQEIGH